MTLPPVFDDVHFADLFDNDDDFADLYTLSNGEGPFNRPVGVTVLQGQGKEAIVVIDQDNNRVHICDLTDATVRRFGSRGDGFGRFLNPVGVAVGEGNRLYVCDHDRHEVQTFREDGTWVSSFGKEGSGRGEFVNPRDLTVSADGSIVVCDKGNNRYRVHSPHFPKRRARNPALRNRRGETGARSFQFSSFWQDSGISTGW